MFRWLPGEQASAVAGHSGSSAHWSWVFPHERRAEKPEVDGSTPSLTTNPLCWENVRKVGLTRVSGFQRVLTVPYRSSLDSATSHVCCCPSVAPPQLLEHLYLPGSAVRTAESSPHPSGPTTHSPRGATRDYGSRDMDEVGEARHHCSELTCLPPLRGEAAARLLRAWCLVLSK